MKKVLICLVVLAFILSGCTSQRGAAFSDICKERGAIFWDYDYLGEEESKYKVYCVKDNVSVVFYVNKDGEIISRVVFSEVSS